MILLLCGNVWAQDGLPVFEWSQPLPVKRSVTAAEYSAPLIFDDHIYVGSSTEKDLLVLDRVNGTLLDRIPSGATVQGRPVIVDNHIYFADTSGTVYVYTLANYDLLWSKDTGAPILSSLVIDEDQILLSNVDNAVYALSKSTGDLVWRYSHNTDETKIGKLTILGSPSPAVHNQRVYAGFSDGAIVAIDVNSGEQKSARWLGEGRYPDIISDIFCTDDVIIAAGFEKPIIALDPSLSTELWRIDAGGSASMSASKDILFHAGGDGVLRALRISSGEEVWSWDSETKAVLTQPILSPIGISLGSTVASLYLINPDNGQLIWTYQPNYLLSGVMSSPIVLDDNLYALSNAGNLLRFKLPKEKPDSLGCWSVFCLWDDQ